MQGSLCVFVVMTVKTILVEQVYVFKERERKKKKPLVKKMAVAFLCVSLNRAS